MIFQFNLSLRKEKLILLLVVILSISFGSVRAETSFMPDQVSALVKKNRLHPDNIGLFIRRLDDDTILAKNQADTQFNPASVAKIITTYAAIDLLGPHFRWQTRIVADAPIVKGVLEGNLYLIGGGDPQLTVDKFLHLLNNLRSLGLKEIRGDIVIDNTIFNLPHHNPAAFDGVPLKPYNAGANGLVLNFNAHEVVIAPVGQKIQTYTIPENENFTINNKLRAVKGRCRNWRGKIKERLSGNEEKRTLTLSGSYALKCGQQSFHISPLNHSANVAGAFIALWKRLGGQISGKGRQGKAPDKIFTLAKHQSLPLSEVITSMNKFSNNVIARNLFLSLSAAPPSSISPYTIETSRKILQKWLKEKGIQNVFFDNGSGLSRESRLSPLQMEKLLYGIWTHPFRPEIISSLPILGLDGTLRKRLKNTDKTGKGHLKTGSLSNVKAISGIVRDAQDRHIALVIFIKNSNGYRAKSFQDDLISWVYSLD